MGRGWWGRLPEGGSVEVTVPATPAEVWAVIADPTRTGEWSHETNEVWWLDGATAPVEGARFAGGNRSGRWSWVRTAEIVTADEPVELAWRTIPTRRYPDSTEWRFQLTAVEGGTRIRQSFRMLELGPVMARLLWLLVPAHRDRSAALRDDLRRIGEVAAISTGEAIAR
jgi:hypothetical protein